MDICKTLGNNFARLRQSKNLTQKEIANKLGIHQSYISALEHGKHNPRATKIVELAEALEVNYTDFFKPL